MQALCTFFCSFVDLNQANARTSLSTVKIAKRESDQPLSILPKQLKRKLLENAQRWYACSSFERIANPYPAARDKV